MKKVVFLYSGEGTRNDTSSFKLIQTSPLWDDIDKILQSKCNISIDALCHDITDIHKCPHSPLVTVISEICLADIWQRWGYFPDVVIGHSIGELSAAYQAGFYTLEEILLLTYKIGTIAGKKDGVMLHGTLSDEQITHLDVPLSSLNFVTESKKHVTVSCFQNDVENFQNHHPNFLEMKPRHPWHHRSYDEFIDQLDEESAEKRGEILFVSGVSAGFEDKLAGDHWHQWLSGTIDFISSIDAIKQRFADDELEIIEIGFHPVLQKCCEAFDSYQYASSMYRGEDEIQWILFQRKKLDQTHFTKKINYVLQQFRPGLDYSTALAYQGFTSLTFVECANLLQPFFPNLAPQDFYRYKTIQQLIDQYGSAVSADAASVSYSKRNQVVISAMSCKFPAAIENPYQFWNVLLSAEDQVKADGARGDFEAGFLDAQTSRFDHKYFNISDAEAKTMDPQQILALELTEMLFKDAGIDPESLNKNRIGVYIGVWNEEYRGDKDSVFYPTGTNASIIASRISYQYDLRGPSWVANTACSSSLLAVHYACKDIEAGRIDYAIAGGVNMILGNTFTHSMRDSGFLSKDQRCKAFDDAANGYVRAEGGGLVLLVNKELAGNYYAEVCGSSINQNGGRAQTITAPHPGAQEELILDACRDAAISPADISYVECHGTGTKIGDPIEISAIQNTVAKERQTACFLGSVKSNLGHLESAAGIAGLLKSVLILNRGVIPGNLHFSKPNQFIDFASYHLHVVHQETPIDQQIHIGISSFGFGGANAHLVIKGADETVRKEVVDLPIPFDKHRATPLAAYYQLDNVEDHQAAALSQEQPITGNAREIIEKTFFELTGIKKIDPDIDLTDQGLDSLSATQFITTIQDELKVELDTDLLFDYPLIDQIVSVIEDKQQSGHQQEPEDGRMSRDELASLVTAMFYELTNVTEIIPDVELTDQGLDSMSATQLISQLESQLKVEFDADILYDFPLYDQLVDQIHATVQP
jgi:acyl transferase domain-containing protein/acyl carrier protein